MLSPTDREAFQKALRSRTTDRMVARRCEVLLAIHAGSTTAEAARLAKVTPRYARQIRSMYVNEGAGRVFQTRLGKSAIGEGQVQEIVRLGNSGPPPLSGREIARRVDLSVTKVLSVLRQHGITRSKAKKTPRARKRRGVPKDPKLPVTAADQESITLLLHSKNLTATERTSLKILRILSSERIDVKTLARREMVSASRITQARNSYLAGGLNRVLGRAT